MANERSGRYATRKARRVQWEATRPVLPSLTLMIFAFALLGLLCGATIGGWFGGFVSGIVVAATIAMPIIVIPSVTGTVPQMMGASAERDVSRVLRRSIRDAAVLLNGVAMRDWEADHLILSSGRALVVETKWSAQPWDTASDPDRRVSGAVAQVSMVARRVKPLLKAEAGLAVPIDRLVVLCGRPAPGQSMITDFDGCPVVFETELRAWIRSWCDGLPHSDCGDFEQSCARLTAFLERRDAADEKHDDDPWIVRVGVIGSVVYGYEAFLAGVVSVAATSWLVVMLSPDVGWMFAVIGGLAVAGYLVLRRLQRKAAAIGWALGSGFLVGFGLVIVIQSLL